MMSTRRAFLATSTAVIFLPKISLAQTPIILRASVGMQHIGPEGFPDTEIWRYDGNVPGPAIRVKQGERITREFLNELPQGSSVHWHGIRIDNKMDGVVGLTQDAVPTGDTFLYNFVAPDAGTYWYHPHNRTWEQMARGLYGPIIVEEATPPEIDRDEVFLIDDWRLTREGEIEESFGPSMDWSHGGRSGNWVTINGRAPTDHRVQHNERLRLRLVNVSNARIYSLALTGLEGWIIALDGQPLEAPVQMEHLVLAPAQRADLILDVTAAGGEDGALTMQNGDDVYTLARFRVAGTVRPVRMAMPDALAPNPVPALGNLETAKSVDLHMEGGAMGRMQGAMLDGQMKTMQELVENDLFWAFNGTAGMPKEPLLTAKLGETVRIKIINDTSFPHAMHLHGFHFRTIAKDNSQGPLRDTILVERGEVTEIAFVADNLGDWLLHCHMLEHTAAGMLTWLKVI